MKTYIELIKTSGYSGSCLGLPENLVDFVAWAKDLLEQIPEEYRDSAEIKFTTERNYDCDDLALEVCYSRPETEEERLQRAAARKVEALREKEWKRRELERLKKELGDE